jgi:predicted RNA polymerase sigma factor
MTADALSPWHLEAAIAAAHLWQPVDWAHIVSQYEMLYAIKPTPVVRLNWAIALGKSGEQARCQEMLRELADNRLLEDYPYLQAALNAASLRE